MPGYNSNASSQYHTPTNGSTSTSSSNAATNNTANTNRLGYQPQPYHSLGCSPYTVSCNAGVGYCNGPTALSSEVQKVNSLAAFTLYNIGLLHQTDRSHKEARESYEIASSMLLTMPVHLGQRTAVSLLGVMIRNNLGCVAYRTNDTVFQSIFLSVALSCTVLLRLVGI